MKRAGHTSYTSSAVASWSKTNTKAGGSPVPRVLFTVLAVAFGAGAVFHVVALFFPAKFPPLPAWRHLLFVGINAASAVFVTTRPRWFVFAFAVLCAQQLVSHGADAWRAWTDMGRVDVASLAVLAIMPLALAALAIDALGERRAEGPDPQRGERSSSAPSPKTSRRP